MAEQAQDAVSALDTVYRDHHAEMTGLARRLLAEEGVPDSVVGAEDVVQTAFAKVLRAPESVREPRAYLYAVIRNDVRAAGRDNRVQGKSAAAGGAQGQVSREVHVADFSGLVANRMAVYKALHDLPPQQRTAVWATKAMDYTQAETAEFMGKRPGTIATHVLRAVVALRANLVAFLVAIATVLVLGGGRALKEVSAAGSERERDPQAFSADGVVYLAGALLLATGLTIWAFWAWRKRRRGFDETGTFARQSVTRRLQQELGQWWWRLGSERDIRRQGRGPDDTYGYARTRVYLPDE
ncbi:RNA polymerase sigma factor [Streptomyces sp. NEAU-Y11]|uniref:RNA polymerase sigma factor n=1 Tax=Streptomyces cucumeris TaxID=2962890 RepID=UPI0020C911DF|nr:RNA polymerase sigma factor [Streptomyces sp. NEAU-Y11]MCP9207187.1 RNA polymerase sigma factor [Streptomyces sp. NEAU-Y11]